MRRKLAVLLLVCLIICSALSCAFAAVPATPNQKLAFRTGPNTKYVELYTLPKSTSISAIEYEEGNGVTWVLVEFEHQGMRCRGYTGLKRMEVNGRIDWANHLNYSARTSVSSTVYAAPSANAYYRGRVDKREWVDVLDYENGYAYIEYYDVDQGMYSRGYVPSSVVR